MIELGQHITTNHPTRKVGRLGAFIENEYGSLLGLTSREIVDKDQDLYLFRDIEDTIQIGERTAHYSRAPGKKSAAGILLGWFAIDALTPIDNSSSELFIGHVEDPACFEHLGNKVKCINDNGARLTATIVSTSRTVRSVLDAGANAQDIYGLIELAPDPGQQDWFDSGISGLGIAMDNGALLGLIVGRSETSIFVSPVADIFIWEEFSLASEETLSKHNHNIHDTFFLDAADEFMSEVSESPQNWLEVCQKTRSDLSDQFTELNNLFGRKRMIELQDELATFLFYSAGPRSITENLSSIIINNDAPGRNANENWLWRALFERLRLLEINSDKKTVTTYDDPHRSYSIDLDAVDVVVDAFVEGPNSVPSNEYIDGLANALLGPDAIQEEVA